MSDRPAAPRLVDEIRQTRPFRSPSAEVALSLMRTAAVIRRRYGRVIEPHGLSLPQYNVLRILRGAGSEGMPTLAVRERMIEEAAGITRLVDKLGQLGFVERVRGGPDRRQVIVRITEPGLALLATLDPIIDDADAEVLTMLDDAEQHALRVLLDRIRGGLGDQLARAGLGGVDSDSLCE
jgi:DNA-binding MarR family transcriptional regulator